MIFSSKKPIGIVSYGAKLPQFKIYGHEIARAQGKSDQKIYTALGVTSKTVPNKDEDSITLATAAGYQALERLQVFHSEIEDVKSGVGVVYVGSESHPYAVKPSGTIVAQALGISSDAEKLSKPLALADLQFACKAGSQGMQLAGLYVTSGFCEYSLAIGTDTAQARPGDVLEYTAGAGAAAYIFGKEAPGQPLLARLVATTSVATDTPDFWRRPGQKYPEHAGRFTADPGYFSHITMAAKLLLNEAGIRPSDFEYCVFHTPNAKFPTTVAKQLGFSQEQVSVSLVVKEIGNTYAGASLLGLINTLDTAQPNKKILVVSYGSGAGSDAFIFETTEQLAVAQKKWRQASSGAEVTLQKQIGALREITYQEYTQNSGHK